MNLRWGLEPAVFSAILISPGTSGAEWVDNWAGNKICIVVRRINVRDGFAELNHGIEDILLRSTLIGKVLKSVTQGSAVSILHAFNKDVCIVVHKVAGIHTLRDSSIKDLVYDGISVALVS